MSASSQAVELNDAMKKELQDVAKKLLVLCAPWPLWMVSGCWIIGALCLPATSAIMATNSAGNEILSYVPLPILADFLSKTGQSIISSPNTFSILTNSLNDPRSATLWVLLGRLTPIVSGLMQTRSLALGLNRHGSQWDTIEELSRSSKYSQAHIWLTRARSIVSYPQYFFPNGSDKKKDIFLNPALVRVSVLYFPGIHYIVYRCWKLSCLAPCRSRRVSEKPLVQSLQGSDGGFMRSPLVQLVLQLFWWVFSQWWCIYFILIKYHP